MKFSLAIFVAFFGLAASSTFAQTPYVEDTVYTVSPTTSGDILICEGTPTCGTFDTTTGRVISWSGVSDVAVYYDSAHGPYDGSTNYITADKLQLFSDDAACGTGFSLCDFMAKYNRLSPNFFTFQQITTIQEDQTTGLAVYGGVTFSSPETSTQTPEPSSLLLLGTGLLGLGPLFRRASSHFHRR